MPGSRLRKSTNPVATISAPPGMRLRHPRVAIARTAVAITSSTRVKNA